MKLNLLIKFYNETNYADKFQCCRLPQMYTDQNYICRLTKNEKTVSLKEKTNNY
jgi:hypothetical protein